jgi:hypothetical protein
MKRTIVRVTLVAIGIVALPVLAAATLILVSAYLDRCPSHSLAEAQLVTARLNNLIRSQGSFSVRELVAEQPEFYCIAGSRADFSELRRFAEAVKYKLPNPKLFCGSWSWNARLLIFYRDSILDTQIPIPIETLRDDSETMCSSDLNTMYRAN